MTGASCPRNTITPDEALFSEYENTLIQFAASDIPTHWPTIQHAVFESISKGAAGHLGAVKKVTVDGDTLNILFPPTAEMSMQLFDKNDNLDRLTALIKKMTSSDIKVKLAIEKPESDDQTPTKSQAQMRDEILSDPAVKMVLSTFNASITKIDFDIPKEQLTRTAPKTLNHEANEELEA